MDETQAGVKISRRNINNLRYADDTTLIAENEEELKSVLKKVKKEGVKAGNYVKFKNKIKLEKKMLNKISQKKKKRSWHLVPSLHGK